MCAGRLCVPGKKGYHHIQIDKPANLKRRSVRGMFTFLLAVVVSFAFSSSVLAGGGEGEDEEQLPRWYATGSFGYTATGGNSRTNTLAGSLEAGRVGIWTDHKLTAGITYGNVIYAGGDPIRNANSYFGKYKLDAYLMSNKKPYAWFGTGAECDEFQGYWGRYTVEAGPGYSFFGTDPVVLKLEAGYIFVDTNWINEKEVDGELLLWEPTHNGLLRLIAELPLRDYLKFTEEAQYYVNFDDTQDYRMESTSALNVKLTDRLSFVTSFKVTYTNLPGLVEKLDEYGNVVTVDDDNDPATDPVPELVEAERVDYTWTNSLAIALF